MRNDNLLGPVEAYDRIAGEYPRISAQRRLYLRAIERIIIAEIPKTARSLLDVGAGDGRRAGRIAREAGIRDMVLLEPSAAMRRMWPEGTQGWHMRAQDLGAADGSFDVITCLWNVLGHVPYAEARTEVLRQFTRLLTPGGIAFVDLNHRYNARHYGFAITAARALRDRFLPGEANGDVIARWDAGGLDCATYGHVFTHREFATAAERAGARITKRLVVDYATGEIQRSPVTGNLLYLLQRATA